MSVDRFLDTNVLLYLFDNTAPSKQKIAQNLIEEGLHDGSACISFQVIQESLNVLTKKLMASQEDTVRFLEDVLLPLCTVYSHEALYRQAVDWRYRYKYSMYDSLILAAADDAGCSVLLSEDLQHGQVIGALRIENPFRHVDSVIHDR